MEEEKKELAAGSKLSAARDLEPEVNPQAGVSDHGKRKMSFKEKREFELLEKEIAELEAVKKQLEQKLNDPSFRHEEIYTASEELMKTIRQIDEKSMRWLHLSELNS